MDIDDSALSTEQSAAAAGAWTENTTAKYLGVSIAFLRQDRTCKGKRRIPFVKLGRTVRYDPADVKAFRESCKVRAR